jgi:hypothetical protein
MNTALEEALRPPFRAAEFDFLSALFGLLLALGLSGALALVYRVVHHDRAERPDMMQSLVLLAVTIAGAMMVIGNNLAIAFGLVGAVSIIRFRTAVKSAREMAFVFIAIVIGMASGLGFRLLAVFFTLFVGLALLLMDRLRVGRPRRPARRFELSVRFPPASAGGEALEPDAVERKMDDLGIPWELAGLRIGRRRSVRIYRVRLTDEGPLERLIGELRGEEQRKDLTFRLRSE